MSSGNDSRQTARRVTVQRLVVVGYILALAFPPLGFGIGAVLALAPAVRSRHGVWIVLASIVAAAIWVVLIGAGALKTTDQGY